MQDDHPSEVQIHARTLTASTEQNVIVTKLSDEGRLRMEVIQSLIEPYERATYGERLREAAAKLGKSERTVRRLIKK